MIDITIAGNSFGNSIIEIQSRLSQLYIYIKDRLIIIGDFGILIAVV
jgi:hypothetical protein